MNDFAEIGAWKYFFYDSWTFSKSFV